jgi:transcriptional regulator with XRE-family HTH domain
VPSPNSATHVSYPVQIRAMRTRLGCTQKRLASEAGMKQNRISLLESTSYEGAVNIKTLLKIAKEFDVGLVVKFAPFSEVAEWSTKLSKASHKVPTFEMELTALQTAVDSEANHFPVQQRLSTLTTGPSNSFTAQMRNAAA